MTNSNSVESKKMVLDHIWQQQGLGTAPFSFRGVWSPPSKAVLEANPEAYNRQMAAKPKYCQFSCDHCGMPIEHHCIIRDAEGNVFCVGSSCVAKTDSAKMISQVKAATNKRNREKAALKRQAKRDEENRLRELKLNAERAKNGGLTDYEFEQVKIRREKEARRAAVAGIVCPIVDRLNESTYGFEKDMAEMLREGRVPSENCQRIIIEIMAKTFGRKNSKAYKENLPIMKIIFHDSIAQLR